MAQEFKEHVMTFEAFQALEQQMLSEAAAAQVSDEQKQLNEMVEQLKTLPAFAHMDEAGLLDAAKGLVQKAGAAVGILSADDKTKLDEFGKKTELTPEEAKEIVTSGLFQKAVNQTRAMSNVEKIAAHRDLVIAEPEKYAQDILATVKAADKYAKGVTREKGKMEARLEKGQDGQVHLAYQGLSTQGARF